MKIINLLNLVYEKKAPKKIKWNNEVWNYMESENDYTNTKEFLFMDNIINYENVKSFLNLEVKIIEDESKNIEPIKTINGLIIDDNEIKRDFIAMNKKDRNIYIPKINELIEAVNEMKEGK